MRYSNVKLYIKYNDIHFTRGPMNEKYLSFMFLNENEDTLSVVKKTEFPNRPIRHYLVPNSLAPFRTYMNADYKNDIKNAKFIPIKANVNEISKFKNKHMYIDTNRYFDLIVSRWNIKIFNNRKFRSLFDTYFNVMNKFIPDNNEKILLYTVNIDKPFNNKLLNKKILPLYLNILNNKNNPETAVPFDKVFYVAYSDKEDFVEYYLIYDKTKKLNISRFRNIITKYKYSENEEEKAEPLLSDEELLDLNDFDEKDIKHANRFSERYDPWLDGSLSLLEVSPRLITKGAGVAWRGLKALGRVPGAPGRALGKGMEKAGKAIGGKPASVVQRHSEKLLKNPELVKSAPSVPLRKSVVQGVGNTAVKYGQQFQKSGALGPAGTAFGGALYLGYGYDAQKDAINKLRGVKPPPNYNQFQASKIDPNIPKAIVNEPKDKPKKYSQFPASKMDPSVPKAIVNDPKKPTLKQRWNDLNKAQKDTIKTTVGAGATALAGSLSYAYTNAKRKEKWYESRCENLSGNSYQKCVNYVNQKKLDMAVKLKDECENDPDCEQFMQNDINRISNAIQQGILDKG